MSTGMKITEQLLKPAIVGGLADIISYVMLDGAGQIQVMGKLVPGWLLIGIVVAAADFAGTFMKEWIAPYLITDNKTTQHLEDMLLTPSLAGLSTWILLDPVLGIGESALASIGIGAVSSWGADYIYKNMLGY
jgi:hypothetical protein